MKQQENNIEFISLINLGIFSTILKDFNREYWIKEIYNYKSKISYSVSKSNMGGWQSQNNLHLNSTFSPLCKILQDLFYSIIPNPQRYVDGMWANISNFTNFNSPHIHNLDSYPYKLYSGILYLNIPPNSGNVVFVNPLNLNKIHSITPKENNVILFPSSLQHYVEPNLSQEDRISIAFNFN
jgi:hypothetical protein